MVAETTSFKDTGDREIPRYGTEGLFKFRKVDLRRATDCLGHVRSTLQEDLSDERLRRK